MDVSGVDVKVEAKADLTPAVKAGSDIATNTHKGVSKLFYALCGPWMEGRVRKAELIAAQTSKDCADIKNGLVTYTGENVIPFEPQTTVASSFEALHKLNHASDAKRLHAAMQEAARQISEVPEEQVSDEPLSQDFFNHWRREAEMIDDEALRQWWARLLVEETKTPKSISPRTLDVAQKLSKDEAQIFKRMLRGVIINSLPLDQKGVMQYIDYGEILQMQDSGLISAQRVSPAFSKKFDNYGTSEIAIKLNSSNYVLCVSGDVFQFNAYTLTLAGEQLASVVMEQRSLPDLKRLVEFVRNGRRDRVFSLYECLPMSPFHAPWKPEPVWTSGATDLKQMSGGRCE